MITASLKPWSTRAFFCPVLIVSPTERPRLVEIRDNLQDRIAEAEREGWLGEAEGLRVSLLAADENGATGVRGASRGCLVRWCRCWPSSARRASSPYAGR